MRVRRGVQQSELMCEPLLTTKDGAILDGRVRWQVAMERHQPSVSGIEYDLTEQEAIRFLLARHDRSEGLTRISHHASRESA